MILKCNCCTKITNNWIPHFHSFYLYYSLILIMICGTTLGSHYESKASIHHTRLQGRAIKTITRRCCYSQMRVALRYHTQHYSLTFYFVFCVLLLIWWCITAQSWYGISFSKSKKLKCRIFRKYNLLVNTRWYFLTIWGFSFSLM